MSIECLLNFLVSVVSSNYRVICEGFDFRFHHTCNIQDEIHDFINDHVILCMPGFANFMLLDRFTENLPCTCAVKARLCY